MKLRLACRTSLAVVLVALVLSTSACSPDHQPPLRIGTNVWVGSEPLYLARDLGRLDRAAVQLVEYPSASEVSRAFRNQAIDGMVASLDELLVLAADGLPAKIVAVIDISNGADVVIGRGGTRAMHDLRGRRVAVESGALGAFVLSRALALNGMRASDVEIVPLESNEHPSAFARGQVDAAVTFDPYRSQLLANGGRVLFDSRQIPGEIVDLLAVRANVLDQNPRAVQALLSGWFGALDYLASDPRDAAARMAVREQITAEQFLKALQGLRIPSHADNLAMLGGDQPQLAVSGHRLMALMLEAKLLQRAPDIKELLAAGPLQAQVK